MTDWKDWEAWKQLWDKWVRSRAGDKNIVMENIQFIDLYNYFLRQLKALNRDPQEIDVEAFLDPTFTYQENKKVLSEILRVPPTSKDYESMYESFKANLESEVREKYPEVVADWDQKIAQLEKDTENLPKLERERKRFKKLSEDLARELDETKQRAAQEKEGLEKKVTPIKLRIIRGFKEGIIEYSPGSVVETRDITWAIDKFEKGYAERIGAAAPSPKVTPPPIITPKPVVVPKKAEKPEFKALAEVPEACPIDNTKLEELTRAPIFIPDPLRLTSEEEYTRAKIGLPIPTKEVVWVDVPATMKVWMCQQNHYFERDASGRLVQRTPEDVYKRILRETAKLRRIEAPGVELGFVPPEVRTRFLQWTRRWEAPEEEKKVFQLHPKDWLLTKGIAWGDFLKLPDEERKRLLDEYARLVRERK